MSCQFNFWFEADSLLFHLKRVDYGVIQRSEVNSLVTGVGDTRDKNGMAYQLIACVVKLQVSSLTLLNDAMRLN